MLIFLEGRKDIFWERKLWPSKFVGVRSSCSGDQFDMTGYQEPEIRGLVTKEKILIIH